MHTLLTPRTAVRPPATRPTKLALLLIKQLIICLSLCSFCSFYFPVSAHGPNVAGLLVCMPYLAQSNYRVYVCVADLAHLNFLCSPSLHCLLVRNCFCQSRVLFRIFLYIVSFFSFRSFYFTFKSFSSLFILFLEFTCIFSVACSLLMLSTTQKTRVNSPQIKYKKTTRKSDSLIMKG
jgi:hypothetical protein